MALGFAAGRLPQRVQIPCSFRCWYSARCCFLNLSLYCFCFSRLPPTVQEAVGNPDNLRNWATSDYKAIETVIQSNFIKTYRSVTSRAEEIKRVPAEIQKLIEKVNQNSLKAQIEQKYQNNTNLLSDKNKPSMSDTEDVEAYSEPPKEFEALKDSLRK